jgi:hypothetical protein
MNVMKRMLMTAVVAAALIAVTVAAAAVVSPANMQGWVPVAETCDGAITGAQGFENGPGSPPAGTGSYFFQVGANGDTYRTLRNGRFGGVKLSDLTALSYWTHVTSAPGQQAVYIDLYIDNDNDGDRDDTLTFEPVYNGTVASNTWQSWNALTGLWWAESSGGPPPLFTLASYASSHPNARIVTDQRGFLLSAGCGGAAWTNFDGNVDLVKIGVSGKTHTFDFEAKPAGGPGKGKKVTICHKGKTITVSENAVAAHQRHGDTLGPC